MISKPRSQRLDVSSVVWANYNELDDIVLHLQSALKYEIIDSLEMQVSDLLFWQFVSNHVIKQSFASKVTIVQTYEPVIYNITRKMMSRDLHDIPEILSSLCSKSQQPNYLLPFLSGPLQGPQMPRKKALWFVAKPLCSLFVLSCIVISSQGLLVSYIMAVHLFGA